MTDKFNPIHQHIMFKLKTLKPLTEPEDAKQFLTTLVHAIGMKPVTEPQAVNVRDVGNEGLTGSINLATSHIAFHCWEETGLLMLDVYSCKCFSRVTVLEVVDSFWQLDKTQVKFVDVDRNDDKEYIRICY